MTTVELDNETTTLAFVASGLLTECLEEWRRA